MPRLNTESGTNIHIGIPNIVPGSGNGFIATMNKNTPRNDITPPDAPTRRSVPLKITEAAMLTIEPTTNIAKTQRHPRIRSITDPYTANPMKFVST